MKHSVLVVDDEADNVDSLERLFRRKYRVLKSTSPLEALELLKKNKITVIISDQRMPQMTGVELLAESIKIHPNAIRMLLTGYTDIDSVIGAINSGQIYRYVTKPWDPVDLSNAVDKAVERFEIGEELVQKNHALETALTELRTLDQAKSQFMILVNHELKTPLTSMLSFAELLAESKLDLEQARMLSRIQSAALRLQTMINDALEYVSAETALVELEVKPHSVEGLFQLQSLPDWLRKISEERGVELRLSLQPAEVLVDEKVIRNIYRRLVHNALKFIVPQSTKIEITGRVLKSGRYELAIFNPSQSIDPTIVARLLKPFTLNENSLNHSVGNGLGLSICQSYLKLHGSSLRFDSQPATAGQPASVTVSFELPCRKS